MAPPALPQAVVTTTATRAHRLQHYLWHALRETWSQLRPADQQRILALFPEWTAPPRPAADAQGNRLRDNDSGEDFFYMHRQMISEVNRILAQAGDPTYPKVQGWPRIPAPNDPDYPVPALPGMGLEQLKSDDFYNTVLRQEERRFEDPAVLRTLTLGQLGSDIQFTIHNQLHMRFAAPSPAGYRPGSLARPVGRKWDRPAYDWLGDTYSSHVNPIFWKLHGWVADRIEDWKQANNVTGEIQWKGAWTGPMEMNRPMSMRRTLRALPLRADQLPDMGDEVQKLEAVAKIVRQVPGFTGIFRPDRIVTP